MQDDLVESNQLGGLADVGQKNAKEEWIVQAVWCAVRLAMRTLCGVCVWLRSCEKAASTELHCALEVQFKLLLDNSVVVEVQSK